MEIFVTGATGAIGRPLSRALVADGHQVVAGTRRPEAYDGAGRAVAFDLDGTGAIEPAGALRSADVAYYLVHALGDADFARIDRDRANRFAEVWGPDRPVVFLGGLGDPLSGSPHLRSRHEVGMLLRARCTTIELRASLVLAADSLSFQLLARLGDLIGRSPVPVPLPRAATTRTQPIGLSDLLEVLRHAPELPPGSYDIGGPEVVPYAELLERSARAQGRMLRTTSTVALDPEWAGPLSALAAGTDPWATSALFAGMGEEAVVRPGHEPPGPQRATTDLDTAIAAALAG